MVGCVLGGSGIKAASDVEALVNTSTEIWLVCIAEAGKLLTLVCRQCPLLGNPVVLYQMEKVCKLCMSQWIGIQTFE